MDLNTMLALMAASIYPAVAEQRRLDAANDIHTDEPLATESVRVAEAIWREVLDRDR